MPGNIRQGEIGEGAKPPRIAGTTINIPPLGMLLWDNQDVLIGETTTIDIFGYTYVTLFVEVDKPAIITLAEVSQDGINWRYVGERIIAFGAAGNTFLSLNEVIETKGVLLYRYLKLRLDSVSEEDSDAFIKITLEATSKLMDLAPILRDILYVTAGILPEWIREIIKEKETIEKTEIITELTEIHELLETRFTNPDTWVHNHKNVVTPGNPVQLFSTAVQDGYALVVKAKDANTDNVYIGSTYNNAKDTTKQLTLAASSSTRLYVKNAEEVWVDAVVAKEGVVYWTEKRKWF